jgi:hypothetical protein
MLGEKKKAPSQEDLVVKIPYGIVSNFEDFGKFLCKSVGYHWKANCKLYD